MKKEGVRRLSMFLGILGVLIWSGIVIVFGSEITTLGIIVGFPVSFFLLFGVVRGIEWVKDGFLTDDTKTHKKE